MFWYAYYEQETTFSLKTKTNNNTKKQQKKQLNTCIQGIISDSQKNDELVQFLILFLDKQ